MKNKLQYVYSISVFLGVLLSSYLMMNQNDNSRLPLQSLGGPGPTTQEAAVVDPVVNQLFEFEEALSNQYNEESPTPLPKRKPTESIPSDL